MEVNVNAYVWVKLTPDGAWRLETYFRNLGLSLEDCKNLHYEDATGWWQFQIWKLMNIFGSACYMGGPQIFIENRIRFTAPS